MDWFVMIDGEERGPMSVVVLARHFAAGEVDGESYVWRDGFDEWLPAFLVEELSGVFDQKPASARRPPPPPAAAKSKRVAPKPSAPAAPPRTDITEPEGVASPSPWENPTHVEPLPLGERVHQDNIASSLFTDPGVQVKVGSTGSFALDVSSWDAAALKAKAAAAQAAAAAGAVPQSPVLQVARSQPLPKPISSAGAARPSTARRQPPAPEPASSKRALLLGGVLLIAAIAGAAFFLR